MYNKYEEVLLWKKKYGKIFLGYEGYQASNYGQIRSYNKITLTKYHGSRHWKNKILKYKSQEDYKTGYRVTLWKDGKPKDFLVARLVATTFLENLIDTPMTVNHKDGNRLNNRIDNLEWLTRADNIKYGFENNQYKQQKILLFNDEEKKEFRSLSQANSFLGRNHNYINNCIKNNRKIISSDGIIYNYKLI